MKNVKSYYNLQQYLHPPLTVEQIWCPVEITWLVAIMLTAAAIAGYSVNFSYDTAFYSCDTGLFLYFQLTTYFS